MTFLILKQRILNKHWLIKAKPLISFGLVWMDFIPFSATTETHKAVPHPWLKTFKLGKCVQSYSSLGTLDLLTLGIHEMA